MKYIQTLTEKGKLKWQDSDAPDANGRFKDLSPKDLAAWLIKTRKGDMKKISGSLSQQVAFNKNDDPEYAKKMDKTRKEVYKQLDREDLLESVDMYYLDNAKEQLSNPHTILDITYDKTRRGDKFVRFDYENKYVPGKMLDTGPHFVKVFYDNNKDLKKISKELGMDLKESVLNEEDTWNDYPAAAKKNAQMAIDWKEKYGRDEVDAGTPVGWARAHQLAKGENLSTDTVKRMSAFNRHRKNSSIKPELKETPWKDRGYVAWLIWGGDEGVDWAIEKSKEIDAMKESKQMKYIKPLIESVNEAKMPKKYIGNDEIVYLKTKEDSRGANYNLYYKGHDIDAGGHRFGSEKELEDFAANYILSNQWYKKLRYEDSIPLPEAFVGPFVFNDRMSDDELKAMYNGALDGYSYYAKGMQYPKSDYKKAYQEIEKILKKRGVNLNEAVAKNTKVYQIATPAPKAMLVGELEDLFGDDYRHIVTEFDDNEGYESVLVFNLTKSDIKRIQEEIGDVLIWEYSIKKGKAINEAKLSTVHKAAKKGSYPAVIVVVQDGKVIHQEPVSTPEVAPATFNVMQKEYPGALLHLEDKTGKRLFSESVVTEALASGSKIEKNLNKALKANINMFGDNDETIKVLDTPVRIERSQYDKEMNGRSKNFEASIMYMYGSRTNEYDTSAVIGVISRTKGTAKVFLYSEETYNQFAKGASFKEYEGASVLEEFQNKTRDIVSHLSKFPADGSANESVTEGIYAKKSKIAPGEYIKTQYGYFYKRVEGKVGGQDAYVEIKKGKEGKRKTSIHDTVDFDIVDKSVALGESVKTHKYIKPLNEGYWSHYEYDQWTKDNGKPKYPKWVKVTLKEIVKGGFMESVYDAEHNYMVLWLASLETKRRSELYSYDSKGKKEFGKVGYAMYQRFYNDLTGYNMFFMQGALAALEVSKHVRDLEANGEAIEPAYYLMKEYFNSFGMSTNRSRVFNAAVEKLEKWMKDNQIKTL